VHVEPINVNVCHQPKRKRVSGMVKDYANIFPVSRPQSSPDLLHMARK
jgi:hypothetical protein